MINSSNIFDLQDIFVNELVGDWWLFAFLALVVIWFIAISNKVPFEIATMFTVLFAAILYFANVGLFIGLWILIILFVGALYYYTLSRPARRG